MVELDWCCKVMAEAPNPCIRRPTSLSYLITRHFSILLCSGWAYGSNLTLFHFCAGGGGILRNLGYGRALVMLNSHGWGSKPMQIASHIHIVDLMSYIYQSGSAPCYAVDEQVHPYPYTGLFLCSCIWGGDITELVVWWWSSYVVRTQTLTWDMVEPEQCCKVMAEGPNQYRLYPTSISHVDKVF
jgi:hypothetical protein